MELQEKKQKEIELSFEQGIKKTVRWYVHQTQIQNSFRRNVTS